MGHLQVPEGSLSRGTWCHASPGVGAACWCSARATALPASPHGCHPSNTSSTTTLSALGNLRQLPCTGPPRTFLPAVGQLSCPRSGGHGGKRRTHRGWLLGRRGISVLFPSCCSDSAGASCSWQTWRHCSVPSSPNCQAGLCGTVVRLGWTWLSPEPPLALCPQSWLRLPQFSWEGRSRASPCPGLLGTSRVPGSAAASASRVLGTNFSLGLCHGGARLRRWGTLLPRFRLAAAPSCAGSRVLCPGCLRHGLGPSSPGMRGGGTGGHHGLCPPWGSALGCGGEERLHSGLLSFLLYLFILFYFFLLFKNFSSSPSFCCHLIVQVP